MYLKVTEMFCSIQGESSFIGLPFAFVRLAGCNLRCSYCDTTYAYLEGTQMSLFEIKDIVLRMGPKRLLITGGEPLIQEQTPELARAFLDLGFEVLVETNGSCDIGRLPPECRRILDIKCPGSGMTDKMRWENLKLVNQKDEVKFVITSEADYHWACQVMQDHKLRDKVPVVFSPAHATLEPAKLAEWILKDKLDVRLLLQLHKIIWPDKTRGV